MEAKEFLKSRTKIILDHGLLNLDHEVVEIEDAYEAIYMALEDLRNEYEEKYKHVGEALEAIIEDCSRLTSGNVSHNAASIRGIAQICLDDIRKHKESHERSE